MQGKLRLVLDLGPLAVFFLMYRFAGLLPATAAIIVATLAALAVSYLVEKRIAIMPLVSGVAITIFGGLTLILHDELFVKMKPTIVNCIFAAILLGGVWFKKPMLKYLLADAIILQEEGWMKLSYRWGIFFLFLAALNEAIWRHFSTDFWVNFKVFGMFTLTMFFTVSQIPLMKRYWIEEKSD
ncbi:MAG: septation protein A [Rickettsiales bacterium]|nr:septation protein A [Rickettsiales bacterium]